MKKLSPEKKLEIYQEFLQSDNKSAVARKYGIDRSYLYDIVKNCNKGLLDYLEQQKIGRKDADMPATITAAVEKIRELESHNLDLEKEKEELWVRNEFLELRLSWAEQNEKNHHLKKTKKSKP